MGEGVEPKVLETSRETLAGLKIASVWKGEGGWVSEREEQQKRGAGRDRVSAIEQVEHSVPAAAALIATVEKGR